MNIFYLEWINKRPSICEFRDSIPKNYNFECKVKLRGCKEVFQDIILYGNIGEELKDYEFCNSPFTKKIYLVSHLQKCIRKMNHDKSIKTAKHLIDLDINSFLRRLPIIMFEDVVPHKDLPIIIWLMVAVTKNFKIKTVMVQYLLGMIYFLSSYSKHDNYSLKEKIDLSIIKDNLFLKTILIRRSYGGMKCDMGMLNYFIEFWHKRLENGIKPNDDKIRYINHDLDRLEIKDWYLQANDFHCNHTLIPNVKRQFNLYSEEYIKNLIWNYSSSYNKRKTNYYEEEQYKDWLIIKKFVRYLQKNMNYI
tara:strand:- start:333 stop:1250 length:918 start_codon:yes stop_codon:yes gene_type:complete